MSSDEQVECEQAVLRSAEFIAALHKHYGDVDPSLVMVDIGSAENYGDPEDSHRRLARPLCFLRSDPTDNGYARPIEGIRPVVDLNTMEVIRVEEFGAWPLPPLEANYSASRVKEKRHGIKLLAIEQPEGPSFALTGNQLSWQNWDFVVGFKAREGLTIHDVRYNHRGRLRPILFRASLTGMVVPYGDPRPTQARKNAFDVGEYGMGMCANSLQLGCDCLGCIAYLDAHLSDSRGNPLTIPNAICIHEEDYGILSKHTDRRLPDSPEVRRSRRLVVSSISTVENYERQSSCVGDALCRRRKICRGRFSEPKHRRGRPGKMDRRGPPLRQGRLRSSGTPSATRTSRAPRTTPLCPRPPSVFSWSPTAFSTPIPPTIFPLPPRWPNTVVAILRWALSEHPRQPLTCQRLGVPLQPPATTPPAGVDNE